MATEGAVFIIITDDNNRIVVIEHNQSAYDRDLGPHVWGLPGGGIDPGETEIEAVIRESREESGIIITDTEKLGTFNSKVIRRGEILPNNAHLFSSRVINLEEKIRKESTEEVTSVKLLSPEEIVEMRDVFMIGSLRMILMYMRCRDKLQTIPFSGLHLKDPVEYLPWRLRDRELVVLD